MRLVAFDLSLTSTGVAYERPEAGALTTAHGVTRIIPPSDARGMARIRWIRGQVMARASDADLVVIEGYAFAAHASHAHELGELGGVVRMALIDRGVKYVDVPPKCLKLFATGRGNAKKEEVLVAAVKKLGYAGHSTDEADALWLIEMGRMQYGVQLLGGATFTDAQSRGLSGVDWPTVRTEVRIPA